MTTMTTTQREILAACHECFFEMSRFFEPKMIGINDKAKTNPLLGIEWFIKMENVATMKDNMGGSVDVTVYFFDNCEYSIKFETFYGTWTSKREMLDGDRSAGHIAHEIATKFRHAQQVQDIL